MNREVERYIKIVEVFLLNVWEKRKYITGQRSIFKHALLGKGYPINLTVQNHPDLSKCHKKKTRQKIKYNLYGIRL